MDELLSKLRSQATQTQQKHKNNKLKEENLEEESNKKYKMDGIEIKDDTEIFEITTSQSEDLHHRRFKLDFDFLKKQRKEEFVTVADVKESDLYKIQGPLWAIIKSIEMYKGVTSSVYRWELCDETGAIFGSSITEENMVKVGNIVCLTDFSLWKFEGNHLNIVARNVSKVIN